MKIIGVIPARYASTRFPGKALADICGKPMLWWVYEQFKKVKGIDEIYVATDDSRIQEVCNQYNIKSVMTSSNCPNHIERLYEVSLQIPSDFYINVNGDEPLIDPISVEAMLPSEDIDPNSSYAATAMMHLNSPIDAVDPTKIKIVTNSLGYGMYMSRSPIPFPKESGMHHFNKYVGIQCFTKKALQFFAETPRAYLENIEDIDDLRFLENGHKIKFITTNANTISVDTPKDLERVISIIKNRTEK